MRSRAVAPATKYTQSSACVIGSRHSSTRTTDGSTGLFAGTECRRDSLFINHPGSLGVAAIMSCEKIGVGEDRGHYIGKGLVRIEIPELSQDFDVAVLGRPHPAGCDQFRERPLC